MFYYVDEVQNVSFSCFRLVLQFLSDFENDLHILIKYLS